MKIKTWMIAALCAALLLLAGASDLRAQGPGARLNRTLLVTTFYNAGIQDAFYKTDTSIGFQYPSFVNSAYGDLRLRSTSWAQWNASNLVDRNGHGVWTLTSDARVAYSGVRRDGQQGYIFPMQYDVSVDPDLSKLGRQYYQHRRAAVKMGYGEGTSGGVAQTGLGGNWWPGSDLITEGKKAPPSARSPVKVLN